jgi:CheY-like chemotaxis protein
VKVLYIEDNDDNVYVVRQRLGRAGFTVVIATDAEHGLTLAVSERPDLILMDLGLPGIDGWEATRRLKAGAETKHIPIIAVSAHAMSGDPEKALAAGCDDYDTKPIDFPRLRAKIQRLVPGDPPR